MSLAATICCQTSLNVPTPESACGGSASLSQGLTLPIVRYMLVGPSSDIDCLNCSALYIRRFSENTEDIIALS
jgi:hypothetical protein